jgi:cobalt/nickel transport system permease protein
MLGPQAGFLTMAVILTIQSLFFADGGLLALGANIFNMGFLSCMVAYPLIFKPLLSNSSGKPLITNASGKPLLSIASGKVRLFGVSLLAAVAALQAGALGVVLETLASGKTELPFGTFALLMQPIHLAIGIVEGLVTGALLVFLSQVEPGVVTGIRLPAVSDAASTTIPGKSRGTAPPVKALAIVAVMALVCGGVLSWFASSYPDGLEWSIFNTAGVEELEVSGGIHQTLGDFQEKTSFLPDYGYNASADTGDSAGDASQAWPAVDSGTTLSGIVGGVMTLALAGLAGLLLYLPKRKKRLLAE